MVIGGFLKFTLIDFPGKIAASIFTRGCNFRCPYCHNPQLVLPRRFQLPIDNLDVLKLLQNRIGKLDGVAISGGEPLLQEGLAPFLSKLKNMGYAVKLDTNGSKAGLLRDLINKKLIDYIAMDIKAPPDKYVQTVRMPVNIQQIKNSMDIIRQSGLKYEFRTTIVKNILCLKDVKEIADILEPNEKFYLQNYIPARKVGGNKLELLPFDMSEIEELVHYFRKKEINCQAR